MFLGRGILGPDAVGATKVWNSRGCGDARASQDDDVGTSLDELTGLVEIVLGHDVKS